MRKNWSTAVLLAGVACVTLPSALGAQEVRNLDQEPSTVRGFSGQLVDGPQLFEVAIAAETALKIDVITTSSLDPVIKVYDVATNEMIVENDDGGEGLNARATIPGRDGRRVRIEVDSYSFEDVNEGDVTSIANAGTYNVLLTSTTFEPQTVTALAWEQQVGGNLSSGDNHEFSFSGEEGILLEVALTAREEGEGLDPFLELRNAQGKVVASNDDGGEGLNSVLRFIMTDGGTYTIVAKAYGETNGAYALKVGERREPIAQLPLQMVGFDDPATGRLGLGYENGGVDPDSILYQLTDEVLSSIGDGDGGITLRMEKVDGGSDDFTNGLDPFLEMGLDTPLGFAVLDSDDDGAGDLNSLLPTALSTLAGNPELLEMLRFRVSSLGDTTGDYVLTVTQGMEERAQYAAESVSD